MKQVVKPLSLLRSSNICRKLFICILLISLSGSVWGCSRDSEGRDVPKDSEKTSFTIKRGLNIACWLSQSDTYAKEQATAFTESHVQHLASYGFDHIRLPVDEVQLFSEDGAMDMETMQLVHNVIRWCQKAGMKVIFDLHIIRSHSFGNSNNSLWNDISEQEKFIKIWKNIADQLEQYSVDQVAYELLNEPVATNDYQWSNLALKLIKELRTINDKRIIVLGSNRWSGVSHVSTLSIPENDPNLILEFHYYEPMLLTHYQASWTDFANLNLKNILQYPGKLIPESIYATLSNTDKKIVDPYNKEYNKTTILTHWRKAIEFAKSKGLRLYCGEFGCLPSVGEKSRLAWTKDIVDLCLENDIPYSYWEYNNIFGFSNAQGNVYNQSLLDCLVK